MEAASSLIEALAAATILSHAMPGRALTPRGGAGALIEIPPTERLVIVGDIHASSESLEAILSSSAVEADLKRGRAYLVFLGDLVHDDRPGHLDQMATSVEILGRLCSLIASYPGRLIWLRGNHDGFDPPLTKGWVRQGEAFRVEVEGRGGAALRQSVQAFFDALPLVALGESIVLVHAGPPRGGMRREAVIEALPGTALAQELVWNRIGTEPGEPGIYCPDDVRRSLQALGLGEGSAFVVGHNPLWSRGRATGLWQNVGLRGHHILYSGALGDSPWLNLEGGRLEAHFARGSGRRLTLTL
ncbi:MAG TPA: metallophosphoesterase [Rectinemataceae bacterium]|nr:metallophosphoesterase [Rectinemataceae bacterium]